MISEISQVFSTYACRVFAAASFVCVLECLFPRSVCSRDSRIRGAVFWLAYIMITASGFVLAGRLLDRIGIRPLMTIDLNKVNTFIPSHVFAGIAASWFVLQIGEFFYYWFHRAQHTSRLLWRFHAVHHSLEEMNAFNCNHHFTEELFRIPFIVVPMSLLFHFEQPALPGVWAFILGIQGVFEHSSTRMNWGWFRYVIPDNCFHRIHHSREKKHFNKNFGSGSALWDIVFGTIHHPAKDEWPDVGLAKQPEPRTLTDFLFRPFYRSVRGAERTDFTPSQGSIEVTPDA